MLIEHGSAHLTLGNPLLDRAVALYEHGITVCVRGYDPVCYGVSRRSADGSPILGCILLAC